MIDIFSETSSTAAIKNLLSGSVSRGERGLAKKVADALKCHPTFVSQTSLGKAWFNHDQAIRFCRYFHLDEDETQYFLDLLSRDRAASKDGKDYFEQRLKKQRESRLNLKERFKEHHTLTLEDQARYYDSWLPQIVHMLSQCQGDHTSATLAERLGLGRAAVEAVVLDLERMGLIARNEGKITCRQHNVHLEKSSPMIRRVHANWRTKTMELMGYRRQNSGLQFSSVFTCDETSLAAVRSLWTNTLEKTREIVLKSSPKTIGVLCIDLYPFLDN